jgi:hypothetical protein
MKLKLPDWISPDSTIVILAGQELVAFKEGSDDWKVKKTRCNKCGACCLEVPEGYLPFGTNGEGRCNMLNDDMTCGAGIKKPFVCLRDPPISALKDLGCCIEYK